jgi:hypothetical protein
MTQISAEWAVPLGLDWGWINRARNMREADDRSLNIVLEEFHYFFPYLTHHQCVLSVSQNRLTWNFMVAMKHPIKYQIPFSWWPFWWLKKESETFFLPRKLFKLSLFHSTLTTSSSLIIIININGEMRKIEKAFKRRCDESSIQIGKSLLSFIFDEKKRN